MKSFGGKLANLFDRYVCLEREVQKRVSPIVHRYCAVCAGECCKIEICKESIESMFLFALVKKQGIRYDDRSGWLGAAGCKLEYGRPPVCYDFFCDDIMANKSFQALQIRKITRDFVSIGNKVYANTHLICVADLDVLTPKKIDCLCDNIAALTNRVARTRFRSDPL
jgi:hypothetical protein